MVGEKHGSTSFRKKLKLSRISFETAGTYRVVAKGKYCQFEKNVEVRVISKYRSPPKPRLNLRYILYLVLFELTWSRGSFLSFFLEGWVDRKKDWEKISENATLKGSHWFWAEHWTDTRKIQNRSFSQMEYGEQINWNSSSTAAKHLEINLLRCWGIEQIGSFPNLKRSWNTLSAGGIMINYCCFVQTNLTLEEAR